LNTRQRSVSCTSTVCASVPSARTRPVRGTLCAGTRALERTWLGPPEQRLLRPSCSASMTRVRSAWRSGCAATRLQAKTEPDLESRERKPERRSLKRTLYLFGLAGGAIGAVSVLGHSLGTLSIENLHDLVKWFESMGPAAVLYYFGLYFVLELVSFPALLLTIGAGYLFGVWRGLLVSSAAATAAAGTSFLLSRYFLRNLIQEKLASRFPRFRAIDRAIAKEGFKIVLLLRLSPLLPFSASNYLYGLTSVRFVPYIVASWLGMLPGTLAYVYAGRTGNAVLERVASRAASDAGEELAASGTGVNTALLIVGLAATAGVLVLIGRTTRQALKEMDEEMAADAALQSNGKDAGKFPTTQRGEVVAVDTPRGPSPERMKRP